MIRCFRFTFIFMILLLLVNIRAFAYDGPGGLMEAKLYRGEYVAPETVQILDTGTVKVWNTRSNLQIRVVPFENLDSNEQWKIKSVQVYVSHDPVPTNENGFPCPETFPYRTTYDDPAVEHVLVLDFVTDMDFRWGLPYEPLRTQNICVHAIMVKLDQTNGESIEKEVWTFNPEYEVSMLEYETIEVGAGIHRRSFRKKRDETNEQRELQLRTGLLEQLLLTHWGCFSYEMAHPRRGHFIDSPVAGLYHKTPTHWGKTDESGGFDYFPGEYVELALGTIPLGKALTDHKISPLDIFIESDTFDPRVINVAKLLQSLDEDGNPDGGINISDAVIGFLETAMTNLGLSTIDFADSVQVDSIIQKTIEQSTGAEGVNLVAVSAEDAKIHLDKYLNANMFRKNVSRTPELGSAKAKLNVMPVWIPALKADGSPATIEYTDENGNTINTGDSAYAKPIIITYTDADPETVEHDVFIAISRDDGNTWKRKNISRMADRSSFTLADETPYYGHCKKPVFQVKGNYILVAWTSKFARGGKPRYAIKVNEDVNSDTYDEDYPYDDPYYEEDIWGVRGPQRSVDYTEQGFPEVGEVPYSAVWTARVVIDKVTGDITYYKPERLTSARRDAYQIFMGGAGGAGFGMVWQEDPAGLRPGSAAGPGSGWGGATTNHKTDIWYSYIPWADFAKKDVNFVSGGDPEHDDADFLGRSKALVPMSLPVRLSDNDAVNTDNIQVGLNSSDVDSFIQLNNANIAVEINETDVDVDVDLTEGTGALLELPEGYEINGDQITIPPGYPMLDETGNYISRLPLGYWVENVDIVIDEIENILTVTVTAGVPPGYPMLDADTGQFIPNINEDSEFLGIHRYGYQHPGLFKGFHEVVNQQGETKRFLITGDDRLLDGNTGASRPNIFLQPYYKPDGSKSAWAIVAYEETKGVGLGPADHTQEGGPYGDEYVPDEGKNVIYHSFDFTTPDLVSAGNIVNLPETDDQGNPVYITTEEGEEILDWKEEQHMAYENARRPRLLLQPKSWAGNSQTVMLLLYKQGQEGMGRPSDIVMRRCVADAPGNPYAFRNFVPEVQNLSSVTIDETWTNPDAEPDSNGDNTKVVKWSQTEENLQDKSDTNSYDDARAHRGAIRGDFVVIGYSWTPNWAASRNAHDKYDFLIRRSFDGGQTWTTDPAGEGVTHLDTFKVYSDGETEDADGTRERYTVETSFAAGEFEPALNVSQLKNNKETVVEPRIVATPGQIWKKGPTQTEPGVPTGYIEDIQNKNVFYLAYGTAENLPKPHGDTEEPEVEAGPLDLYFSFTQDKGESFREYTWLVNPESEGNNAGVEVTGWERLAKGEPEQGECQLRMTPDGSRFYSTWLQEGIEGSDIFFRRIMDSKFPNNNANEN